MAIFLELVDEEEDKDDVLEAHNLMIMTLEENNLEEDKM